MRCGWHVLEHHDRLVELRRMRERLPWDLHMYRGRLRTEVHAPVRHVSAPHGIDIDVLREHHQ